MNELHQRSCNPKYKKKYRVTNWKEYEQSLCNRGSLTLWISPSVIKSWKPLTTKKRGRQQRLSDRAIETILSQTYLSSTLETNRRLRSIHIPFDETQAQSPRPHNLIPKRENDKTKNQLSIVTSKTTAHYRR